MIKVVFKNYSRVVLSVCLLVVSMLMLQSVNLAQSSSPDNPTTLTNGIIEGSSSGGLSDEKTYYYAFNVNKGTLTVTLDVTR